MRGSGASAARVVGLCGAERYGSNADCAGDPVSRRLTGIRSMETPLESRGDEHPW